MKIVVAILNFNGKHWLEKFLSTVIENSPEAEICIIDNCSTDDSVDYIKSNFPQLKLIINSSNEGFAGGYNEGLKNIVADYFILLNSDIEVTKNWISPVIEVLESDSNIVAAQPKILAYNNKEYFEHAGAGGGMIDKNGYPFCRGRIFDLVEKDEGQYNDITEIFWATGACLFIRAEAFKEQKGFDATFFAHMEEIDLCWRLKNDGKKIMYCGKSTIFHVGGGTLDYKSPRKTYLNFRNSLYTLYKNYKGNVFSKIFLRLILDGIAGIKFLVSGNFKHIGVIIKAHFSFYFALSELKEKRKKQQKKDFLAMKGVYPKSIVWKRFISGAKTFNEL